VSLLLQPATLMFREDGTAFSPRHEDIYHSAAGALAQARHVFVRSNGLPERWRGRHAFTVLETGFGMGINFLATWAAWRDDDARPATLDFVSIEKYPFSIADLRRAHAALVDDKRMLALAALLAQSWPALEPGVHRLAFDADAVTLTLVFADIAEALASLTLAQTRADAIYLDGFAPARNAEMWTPQVIAALASLSNPDATFSTYTSAGSVKRTLRENGFDYRKVRGFGGKRAMLVGTRSTR
jgi:tRNA U34 5-methylaminomethyl-2-thiouridine-forming methyltransferase MnmC